MFRVDTLDDPLESIALVDTEAGSRVVIAPARGGLVTRFRVGDDDVLFLDEATLRDQQKNVRGGIPVLFPTPGKLEGDKWSYLGHSGQLKQHGFARDMPWRLARTATDDAAVCTLRLVSDADTHGMWPWEFDLEHRISLTGGTLHIEQRLHNPGHFLMPFGLGFHPYFRVPQADKTKTRIATRATRAWDNVKKTEVELHGIELSGEEVDLHLLDHKSSESALERPGGRINVRASQDYQRWVVWTLHGRDFVCLEPWTSPGNALNSGEGLLALEAGATRTTWVEISVG